jgi:hypothetical protein
MDSKTESKLDIKGTELASQVRSDLPIAHDSQTHTSCWGRLWGWKKNDDRGTRCAKCWETTAMGVAIVSMLMLIGSQIANEPCDFYNMPCSNLTDSYDSYGNHFCNTPENHSCSQLWFIGWLGIMMASACSAACARCSYTDIDGRDSELNARLLQQDRGPNGL